MNAILARPLLQQTRAASREFVLCSAMMALILGAARLSAADPGATPAARTVLGLESARFTLNGQPVFLLGISYYGGLGASDPSIQQDLDDIQRHGFNWIRVWATWGAFDHDVSAVDSQGQPREPFLARLRWLVAQCDRRGLVVDVTLTRNQSSSRSAGAAGLADFAAHQRAVETVIRALDGHRNWYLDLANERDVRDARYVSTTELKELRALARRLDPQLLVTASFGGHDLAESDVRDSLIVAGHDFLTPHRPRDAQSPMQTEAKTRACLAMALALGRAAPVHHQEPFRRGYTQWNPAASDFLTDLRGAVAAGAAGWCFHNGSERGSADNQPRRSFDLRDRRLFDQLDPEERKVVAQARDIVTSTDMPAPRVTLEAPDSAPQFDPAEFVLKLDPAPAGNAFTNLEYSGEFTLPDGRRLQVPGFCDAQDGSLFRLRFCPEASGAAYGYRLSLRGAGIERQFAGQLRCEPSGQPGPVVADPSRPRHFIRAGTGAPFYHLGLTAYHLLDPSNDDAQIDATIDYAARAGFNKIRFLLAGYPRDFDRRTSQDVEHGVPDPWKAPNYGGRPGQVNPLPAWIGKPHAYDFTRFNVAYWQRVDRAVRRMRDAGILATCIVTIEKQNLPKEYGALTGHEFRLYRYAVARLAAFDNVWWDLGNEHNEYRNASWANAMGGFVAAQQPWPRLISAHGYAEFLYTNSAWAGFIITQQYGDEKAVHDWALQHAAVPKPYVNEEYGYEGALDQPGHGQNTGWVRRCHWAIAMAGGYATYGDWSGGVSYFYMGEPGPGQAARQLGHLRSFFEAIPFAGLESQDALAGGGFCLARKPDVYVFYFPRGGRNEIDLHSLKKGRARIRWFDPREGQWRDGPALRPGKNVVETPTPADWALLIQSIP